MINSQNFSIAGQMSSWLYGEAIPFWLERGVDRRRGGFIESLTMDGFPQDPGFKRTRVTARQIYCFAHAGLQGISGCVEAAEHGIKFLMSYHKGASNGSWVRTVTTEGSTLDSTDDLYDIAFVLFALAWWFRLTRDDSVIPMARQTVEHIVVLRHSSGLGYRAAADAAGSNEQNPHMHLLEALIELFKVTQDQFFLDEAHKIKVLFSKKFVVNGTVREFFDGDWRPAKGIRGQFVEPGHMSEWAWILFNYGKISGNDIGDIFVTLMNGVLKASELRSDGLLPDVILDNYSIYKSDVRLWPQTEFIKGLVALSESSGHDYSSLIEGCWSNILDNFLDPAPRGCWHDHLNNAGSVIVDKVPASSLYHISLACSEVLRIYK